MNWNFLLNPAVIWVFIPVSAIVVSGIVQLAKLYCRHHERIEMIQQGIHPDAGESASTDDDSTWDRIAVS